MHKS
jgi:glycerol-3-phosphate dehydrogenase